MWWPDIKVTIIVENIKILIINNQSKIFAGKVSPAEVLVLQASPTPLISAVFMTCESHDTCDLGGKIAS